MAGEVDELIQHVILEVLVEDVLAQTCQVRVCTAIVAVAADALAFLEFKDYPLIVARLWPVMRMS